MITASMLYGSTRTKAASTGGGGSSSPTSEAGSYTGAGTYGSGNKNSITFSQTPKMVAIAPATHSDGYARSVVFINGCDSALCTASNGSTTTQTVEQVTWNGATLTWYCTNNAARQMNASGVTYNWTAVY